MKLSNIINNFFLLINSNNSFKDYDNSFKKYQNLKFNLSYYEDKCIGIYLDKDYNYLFSILVLIELGIKYVPLNKVFPLNKTNLMIKLAKCDFIISEDNIFNNTLLIDTLLTEENKLKIIKNKNNIMHIIFTSGSTGNPKGIKTKREAFYNYLLWVNDYFSKIDSKDTLLNLVDFTFDVFLLDISLLLTKNINFYFSKFNGNIFYLLSDINKYKPTILITVPNNINMLYQQKIQKYVNLDSLKYLLIGGDRFPIKLLNKLLKNNNLFIYNLYGPTETTSYCSVALLNNNSIDNGNITIGKSIKNMNMIIKDNELLINGIQLMDGYLDANLTKNCLVTIDKKIYYKTGDIAYKKNGEFYIIGRMDDTIKIKGYRVNLNEIDFFLLKIDYIQEARTIAIKNELDEFILISFLMVELENRKNIKKDIEKFLAFYQRAEKIIFITKFPVNNSGKISKKELKENYLKGIYND